VAKSNKSNKSEVPVPPEAWEFMEKEWARIQWEEKAMANFRAKQKSETKSGFRSMLSDFVERARAGQAEYVDIKAIIDLNGPAEGSSAKHYEGAGWNNVKLTDIQFVDDEGISFYPYGSERSNPVVFVPWSSVFSIILR
jgi:hypothetical protein